MSFLNCEISHNRSRGKHGCVLVMIDNDHIVSLDMLVGDPSVLSLIPFLNLEGIVGL